MESVEMGPVTRSTKFCLWRLKGLHNSANIKKITNKEMENLGMMPDNQMW